jgi:hypothetical protein
MDVGVNHRGLQGTVPEQELDRTDIRSLGQKVGGKGVAQRVDTGMLAHPRSFERLLERPLDSPPMRASAAASPFLGTAAPRGMETRIAKRYCGMR